MVEFLFVCYRFIHSFNLNVCVLKSFKIICYWTASSSSTIFSPSVAVWPIKRLMKIISGCDMTHIRQKQQPHSSRYGSWYSAITQFVFSSRLHLSIDVHPADSQRLSRLPAGSTPSDDNLFLIAFVVSTAMTRSLNPETCSPHVHGLWSNSKYQKQSDSNFHV